MKKMMKALLGLSALTLPAAASASVTITFDDTSPVAANNDFILDLAALGLVQMDTTGASIILNVDAPIRFDFLGSESGASDTFTAGAVTHTETSLFEDHFPAGINLGSDDFLAGDLAGILNFTSSLGGGSAATVGDAGFAIFLPAGFLSGSSTNVFYIAYDDQTTSPDDDNHDDFIVRATVLPEPGTWAMMLFGFGAVGYAMRRRRRPALAQLA